MPPTTGLSDQAADLDDFVFSDASHGVAALTTCAQLPIGVPPLVSPPCQLHVDTSDDGGANWQRGPTVASSAGYFTARLSASSTAIYLLVGSELGTPSSLLVSHDEGQTWTPSPLSDPVAVVPGAGDDLALSGTCVPPLSDCTDELWASADSGSSWQARPSLPVSGGVELARGGAAAFLLAGSPASGPNELSPSDELLSSTNEGVSWVSYAAPCAIVVSPPALVALDAKHLWMACGSEPGAGIQAKTIWRSDDGGATWETYASIPFQGSNPAGQLGSSGYVESLAVINEHTAFLGLRRGTLFETVDGGLTWTAVGGGFPGGEAFVDHIEFIGAEDGWADNPIGGQVGGLYRTTDGGRSWTQSLSP